MGISVSSRNLAGLVTVVVCAAVAAGLSDVPSGSASRLSSSCPAIHANSWQKPFPPYARGTAYAVTLVSSGITCAKADADVRILATRKVEKGVPESRITPSPAGLQCIGSASKAGLAYLGNCVKTGSKAVLFAWGATG